jgi:uncharacterized protein YidB (DUF937 family)
MGLLDTLAGEVMGALSGQNAQQGSGAMGMVAELLGGQGGAGLSGLVQAFEQQGLGEAIASWIGTGQNQPISAEQIQSVLGSEQVQAIAQKFGLSTQEAAGQFAQLLPQVIDKLTPGGQLPQEGNNLMGSLLGMLKG